MSTNGVIKIEGSEGEGGGQVLRSALALSVCLGKPFIIENIRGKRKRPGLLRQHLTAVKAAKRISYAKVEGDSLGSQYLEFEPAAIQCGNYDFSIGTAGSTTLVLQTILLPLLFAKGQSKVCVEGGTHNPLAPPFEFIQQAFVPVLQAMGASVQVTLKRPGFFPAGGGMIELNLDSMTSLQPINITEKGELVKKSAIVHLSNLPTHIAERELKVLKKKLGWEHTCFHIEHYTDSGPGNVICVYLQYENITEVIVGFGQRGINAEKVAISVANEVQRYLKISAPVGEHLADQLLLPMALAGSGKFVTTKLSQHCLTNMDIIAQFLDVQFSVVQLDAQLNEISIGTCAE